MLLANLRIINVLKENFIHGKYYFEKKKNHYREKAIFKKKKIECIIYDFYLWLYRLKYNVLYMIL